MLFHLQLSDIRLSNYSQAVCTLMIHYHISYKNPLTQLLDIVITIEDISTDYIEFQLPAWRPGRYELQNYASNILGFAAFNKREDTLGFSKPSRNKWKVETKGASQITIQYQYYASQMDAGGCWLDEEQLYLNFICCMLYAPEKIQEAITVTLSLPPDYQIACGLPHKQSRLNASDFYHLVDSPMIASNSLTHLSFECQNIPFNIWIQGKNFIDPEKIKRDFKKYTEVQIAMMGDFPEKEYHYLFQFLPYKHYHGVEHHNSTVITLGPTEEIPDKGYSDLLGISSHELFHAWNIIKIRPIEMMPYDFTKENYFQTGFVAEGFTTYYGDLFLVRAGIISKEEYFQELNTTLKRHFDNLGNFNLSLAESSQELWIDGYVAGIPNRKVSIYVKGCVVALLLDLEIRKLTNGQKSLDDLMRLLWNEFGKTSIGYSMQAIIQAAEKIAGSSLYNFFQECVFGHTNLKSRLENTLPIIGCMLQEKEATTIAEKLFGFRYYVNQNKKIIIESIAMDSPAEIHLCKGDELVSANRQTITETFDTLLDKNDTITLHLNRKGRLVDVSISKNVKGNYFLSYQLEQNNNASPKEIENFTKWIRK